MSSEISKIYEFNNSVDFTSTAIKKVSVIINETDQRCYVSFINSTKDYEYVINDPNFVDTLRYTVVNKESIGKFITSSIKDGKLSQLNINIQ